MSTLRLLRLAKPQSMARSIRPFHSTGCLNLVTSKNKNVHQTDHNEFVSLNNATSTFKLLSYKALKDECKKRGLKLAGKKVDLIDRLISHEGSQSRALSSTARVNAKNDDSRIDSFKMPSQTSLNEWEYKYDYEKPVTIQIPALTTKAAEKDIKPPQPELDTISSVKVEGSDAQVVHSGDSVVDSAHVHVEDKLPPSSASSSKTVNSELYSQSATNPGNSPEMVNLGESTTVMSSQAVSSTPTPIIEDPHTEIVSEVHTEASPASSVLSEGVSVFTKWFDEASSNAQEKEFEYDDSKISTRDKQLFGGLFVLIGGWWLIKPSEE